MRDLRKSILAYQPARPPVEREKLAGGAMRFVGAVEKTRPPARPSGTLYAGRFVHHPASGREGHIAATLYVGTVLHVEVDWLPVADGQRIGKEAHPGRIVPAAALELGRRDYRQDRRDIQHDRALPDGVWAFAERQGRTIAATGGEHGPRIRLGRRWAPLTAQLMIELDGRSRK